MKKAQYYKLNSSNKVLCQLCPHYCTIPEDKSGICRTRINQSGTLYSENYGKVASIAIDPIEKKPLYHFKPGSKILSIGSYGCNMRCSFCQNYSLSQAKVQTRYLEPENIIDLMTQFPDNIGIAFTYNEPLMWYEYILNVSKKIKEVNPEYAVVIVTNGYINPEPLREILPYIDAMNIDLKTINNQTYQRLCKGKLDTVLQTIETSLKHCHVEVTSLIITGENDSESEIEELAIYLGKINKNIPLHLSRYFPNYKMNNPPTPVNILIQAKEIAEKYLNYVYVGNLPEIEANTYCPKCGELLIERKYYHTIIKHQANVCPVCQKNLPIIL
jgi:pyruvate formate lyase activating enzyme